MCDTIGPTRHLALAASSRETARFDTTLTPPKVGPDVSQPTAVKTERKWQVSSSQLSSSLQAYYCHTAAAAAAAFTLIIYYLLNTALGLLTFRVSCYQDLELESSSEL